MPRATSQPDGSPAPAAVDLDSVDGIETHTEITALATQIDGIGRTTARRILKQVGCLDRLESMPRQQALELEAVGPVTVQNLGIWNSDGVPVNTLERDPCPSCSDPYTDQTRLTNSGETTVDVSEADTVCVRLNYGGQWSGPTAAITTHTETDDA